MTLTFNLKSDIAKIHVFLTSLLVALIPFAVIMISYAIIIWLLSAIFLIFFQKKNMLDIKFDLGLISCLLLYLVFFVGVFYSQNISAAIFDVQLKLSLLVIPPVIYILKDFYRRYYHFILLAFVIANIVAGLFCIGNAFFHSLSLSDGSVQFDSSVPSVYADKNTEAPSYFTYANLSFFKHPAYFSMYLVLCVFILIYFFNNSYYFLKNRMTSKIIYVTMALFIVMLIFLLKSKAAYGTLVLFSVIYFIYYTIVKKKKLAGILIIGVLIVLSVFAFKQNSRFYYVSSLLKNNQELVDAIQRNDHQFIIDRFGVDRIPIWMVAFEIIQENPVIGVGTGDVRDHLMDKYKKYNLETLCESKYNTHNQYLETTVAIGLLGFFVFAIWLFYPLFLKRNYHKNSFLILIFTGILVVNYMFEAVLNTISGVIFIAFFYGFLLFVPSDKLQKENT